MTKPLPHTGSYYAASLNDDTRYAPLRGEQRADVCVIGAGFSGISSALHLAERGYNVQVVEANQVGWGASGRNGGQMIGGIAGEQAIAKHHGRNTEELFSELRWAGHDIIRQRVKAYDIDCDLKAGYLDVAIKQRHLHDIKEDYARLSSVDFPYEVRILDREETRELTGTDAYLGALLNMRNGHLHPLNLCAGEARAAVGLGARIYEQSPVLRIESNAKPRVVTEHGAVTADSVILAGNAYHSLHKKLRGVMFPVNSFIVATEPLSDKITNSINPRDLAICDPNFVLEYYRLSADKRLLFGGRFNYFGDDPEYIKQRHRKKITRLYPQLHNVRLDYAWGGTIGVPISRVPQLGRVAPNVFFSQGYSGHGVNVTHLAGRILADAVAGTMEQFDLFADVEPIVVPGAHMFRKPIVSLGMMYYTIKDRL